MAKLVIELEMEITVPDVTGRSYHAAVQHFFKKIQNVPIGRLMEQLRITHIRKIEPWEDSIPRF